MYIIAHNGSSILGGGEIGSAFLLAGLQDRGHRVLMLCRDTRMAERIAPYGIPTDVLHIGGDAMLPDALRFARRLRKHRPDALILTTFKKVFLAGLGAWIADAPLVVQRVVLSTDVPRSARYRFALERFVDVVVLNAREMRSSFLARGPGLDPERVLTVYDGVHVPRPEREVGALRREFGIPGSARVMGAVTRLVRQKRLDRLMRSLAAAPADVHCIVAGEGPDRASLERLALDLGVQDRLHLVGFRTDVGDVLNSLDLFVICSDREGMANAMLEAMALGVPVVSTAVSGAREALEPLENGVAPGLVVGFGQEELSAAIRRLLQDEALRSRMSEAGRVRVRERFSFEQFLDSWESLLTGAGSAARVEP